MRDLNLTRSDTLLIPQHTFSIRVHVLLQSCIYAHSQGLPHETVHKHNPMLTLQPQNASIIQSSKFLCLFLLSVFIRYSFCLVALLRATVQGWRISIWFIHFPPLPSLCQCGSNSGISSAPTHLICCGRIYIYIFLTAGLVVLESIRYNNLPELSVLRWRSRRQSGL